MTKLYCFVDLGWINQHTVLHRTILVCGFRLDKSLHCNAPRHASDNSPGLTSNIWTLIVVLTRSHHGHNQASLMLARTAGHYLQAAASMKCDTNFVNPRRQKTKVQHSLAQSYLKLLTDQITE